MKKEDLEKNEWICIAYMPKDKSDSVNMCLARFID